MMPFEDNTEVFIIRIWLERRESREMQPEWRGRIEHVFSGKRRYLTNPGEIIAFIRPYMEDMGINFPPSGE